MSDLGLTTSRRIIPAALLALMLTHSGCCRPARQPNGPAEPCKTCRTHAELKTTKHPCWDVERKELCVPGVHFPWDDCGQPGHGAGIARVNVLKQSECESETCVYSWTVEPVCEPCPVAPTTVPPPPPAPAPSDGENRRGGT